MSETVQDRDIVTVEGMTLSDTITTPEHSIVYILRGLSYLLNDKEIGKATQNVDKCSAMD